MKVKDSLQGLFVAINNKQPFKVFELLPPLNADKLYIMMHGNRTVSECVTDTVNNDTENIDVIAEVITDLYSDKWERDYNLLTKERPFFTTYKETITENVNNIGTANTSNEVTNKVSAYNEDDFTNADNEKTTNTLENENSKSREYIRQGFQGDYVKELKKELDFIEKNMLCDIMFNDINKILTLNIWSD